MAEKKKENIFKRIFGGIAKRFVEVRQEMKRVIWPTKAKLMQVAVVVLAVILAAAVLLSLVGQGTSYILGKFGFYNQVTESTATTTETTVTINLADETTVVAAETTAA